jgi:hypothetical protein
MVWLGGPRRPGRFSRRPGGIYLHDPPPGYRPPRPRMPLKDRQRQAREDWILLRVLTVVLVLTAAAVLVIVSLIIATHS